MTKSRCSLLGDKHKNWSWWPDVIIHDRYYSAYHNTCCRRSPPSIRQRHKTTSQLVNCHHNYYRRHLPSEARAILTNEHRQETTHTRRVKWRNKYRTGGRAA